MVRRILVLGWATLGVALPAAAQETVRGIVTDIESGRVLTDALVQLPALTRAVRTDSAGRFVLRAVPPGQWQLVVARIGYAPRIASVQVMKRATGDSAIARDIEVNVALSSRLELAPVQVSAAAQATTPIEAPQAMAVLSKEQLRQAPTTSVGEAVEQAPGMRVLTMSTGIGKPIVRGLSSQRVITLDNGQRVESQQWGTDHAPTMESQGAERIEIIKGPASVLYGSDAIGGVVNVIARPLPEGGSTTAPQWETVMSYGNNPRGHDAMLGVEGGSQQFGWRAGVTQRGLGDMRGASGILRNTANRTDAYQLSGAVRGSRGTVTLRATRRDERIRIMEDPAEDPLYTGHQRVTSDRYKLELRVAAPRGYVSTDLSYEGNTRLEYESHDARDVTLGLVAHTGATNMQWHHTLNDRVSGMVGVAASAQQFRKRGLETLIPDASAGNVAFFAFEQARIGALQLAAGIRWDERRIAARRDSVLELEPTSKRWHAVSGNLGATWLLDDRVALLASVARGFRSPWYHELFANGFHEGTRAFEIGNPDLDVETSLNTDVGVRFRLQNVTLDAGAFSNRVRNFIYLMPIGPEGRRFDSLSVAQGDAWLRGAELDARIRAYDWLTLELGSDLTVGQNRTTGEPLPQIPPLRTQWGVTLSPVSGRHMLRGLRAATLTIREERHAQQRRVHPNDLSTPGYALHHATLSVPLDVGGRRLTADLMTRNVGNVRFRPFLSRYKEFADGMGRSVMLRVSVGGL